MKFYSNDPAPVSKQKFNVLTSFEYLLRVRVILKMLILLP
jgi:hypothetical protein